MNDQQTNRELAKDILLSKTAYAFEGGGILGIGHAGALVRLHEMGGLKRLNRVVGTSVGSIVAMALACGADANYIEQKLFGLNFKQFRDGGCCLSVIWRFLFRYGAYRGDRIERFAAEILTELTGNGDITFRQAYQKYNIHLTVTYLSVRHKKTKYADYITSPDLKIRRAVRWSSAIPYFYRAGRSIVNMKLEDLLVDGGVTDNYPIHVLRDQYSRSIETIGFKLCDNNEINEYQAIRDDTVDQDVDYGVPKNIKNYSLTLLDILRQQALRYHVNDNDWKLTCKIDIGRFSTTDFDITEEDMKWLYESGKKAVDDYLLEIETLLDRGEYPI